MIDNNVMNAKENRRKWWKMTIFRNTSRWKGGNISLVNDTENCFMVFLPEKTFTFQAWKALQYSGHLHTASIPKAHQNGL